MPAALRAQYGGKRINSAGEAAAYVEGGLVPGGRGQRQRKQPQWMRQTLDPNMVLGGKPLVGREPWMGEAGSRGARARGDGRGRASLFGSIGPGQFHALLSDGLLACSPISFCYPSHPTYTSHCLRLRLSCHR